MGDANLKPAHTHHTAISMRKSRREKGAYGLLIALALLSLHPVVHVNGQSPTGFLNIDCGKPKNYANISIETGTPLVYTSDFDYIDTGEIYNTTLGSDEQFDLQYDVRSFPIGRRNCYSLKPVSQGKRFLVRAIFYYGNYDRRNLFPKFDLYLGTKLWTSVVITVEKKFYQWEIMALATSDSMSVCLVNTGNGVPFISAIELRPLQSTYNEVNSSQSLLLYRRSDTGESKGQIRYPTDPDDRIWSFDTNRPGWSSLNTTSVVKISPDYYEPPILVMKTALISTTGTNLDFTQDMDLGTTSNHFHIIAYFAELQLLNKDEIREFDIIINDEHWQQDIKPKYREETAISATVQISDKLLVSFSQTNRSTLPPILNAIEIFGIIKITEPETDSSDVDAMMDIKKLYNVKRNWNGDPCSPENFTWDGLNCSSESPNKKRITSLNLSSSGLTGGIPSSLANFTQLQYLDLSRNNLTGPIPDFLASLSNLKLLNLTGNNLNGPIPDSLLDRFIDKLLALSTGDNPNLCDVDINLDKCRENKKKNTNKVKIAVSALVCSIIFLSVVLLIFIWRSKRRNPDLVPLTRDSSYRNRSSSSLRVTSFRAECRKFTYSELVNITNNFRTSVGKGGFGTVYHGVLENDIHVAVKILSHLSAQGPKEFQAEARLLTRIHHRNLVPLLGYCSDINHLALVYEYMVGGSLEDHLSGKTGSVDALSWKQRLRIAMDAAQGLEYLHKGCKPAIIHRDVKTSNILLTQTLEARIADFGLSKIFQNDDLTHMSTTPMGTPGYLDPECYITNKLNEKSDVYSFGIVLLQLLTGLPAIIKERENVHIVQWVETRVARGEINEVVDKRLQGDYDINSIWKIVDIALACSPYMSIQRPTISEVLTLLKDCWEIETFYEKSKSLSKSSFEASGSGSVETNSMHILAMMTPSSR